MFTFEADEGSCAASAAYPSAVLLLPSTFVNKAFFPTATLYSPTVLEVKLPAPTDVFS